MAEYLIIMSEDGFTATVLPTTGSKLLNGGSKLLNGEAKQLNGEPKQLNGEPKHLNGGPTVTPYPSHLVAIDGGNNVSFVNITYSIQPKSFPSLFVQNPTKKILDNIRYAKNN